MIVKVFGLLSLVLTIAVLVTFSGCYYDVEEELYPPQSGSSPCDTSDVRYSVQVSAILDLRCNGCHGGPNASAGIRLDNYSDIKNYIEQTGTTFVSSIEQDGSASAMPQGQPRIPDCEINQIKFWVASGYPEN